MRSAPRTYGGLTQDERRAERRRRLLDAAIAIWGDEGWAAVTMRRVCADAHLIDRYFYENFADRDALLVAAWDHLRDDTVALVVRATLAGPSATPLERLRAAIAAFVQSVESDPRRARIQFAEHAGSAALEARRRDMIRQFTNLLVELGRPFVRQGVDENAVRMSTIMGIGGFLALLTAKHDGGIDVDSAALVAHATTVGADIAARYLRPEVLALAVAPPEAGGGNRARRGASSGGAPRRRKPTRA